jgi:collagenase-like PrtC family protease
MRYFCLPSDFKEETINSYQEINCKYNHSMIIETYGQLTCENTFEFTRSDRQTPDVDREKLEKYVNYSYKRGIQFNYTHDSSYMADEELTLAGYKKTQDFFHTLQEMGISSITLTLPSLMEICKYAAPSLNIRASASCQINSPIKAKFYDELGVKRIILDEDINRRFDILSNIRDVYTGDLEIVVNSHCLNDCPYKIFHNNSMSLINKDKAAYPYYSTRCKNNHIGAENFMKLNWIRPEDIHFYNETGIDFFRIQGKATVFSGNPVKAVNHYIKGYYEGDLVKLLELFSPIRELAIAETAVNNRALDGFIDMFVYNPESCTKKCDECGYCKSYGEASMTKLDRFLMDLVKSMNASMLDNFPSHLENNQNLKLDKY